MGVKSRDSLASRAECLLGPGHVTAQALPSPVSLFHRPTCSGDRLGAGPGLQGQPHRSKLAGAGDGGGAGAQHTLLACRLGRVWPWGLGGHLGPGLAGGSSCLTLARRRAGEAAPARRVADHSALLQACGVRRRSSEEAQQRVVVTQGREGADRQLHLGKGRAARTRSLLPQPGEWASSQPGPTRGTCPLVCSMAALLNVDPCSLESSLEPNSTSPKWDPI